ncbi:hypothetical protein IMG5_173770 [Ichthyophthirius multifiliis]|uniref:Calpain catalytic domain-containing protein n=1 Tax=Ichthyophthirius multifiliis TaxID=5932 RepID=G0R1Z6_ICHMU|nr:hypothetical protein IMG5_173770 [Ichthyophthirius multifiliis]EGR28521.1 hypothetical protein IMG5_173770 [Ichthyophthirius multifiliis]|eukprot:XP_004029757.1 hypothetical protein IMG5_173770 [Ichthyophthirius multifiliis]
MQDVFSSEYGLNLQDYNQKSHELQLLGEKGVFYDEYFPPTKESLCEYWNLMPQQQQKVWEKIQWLRPNQIFDEFQGIDVFKEIEVNDIKQGILGDSYFLCSLSSLAERKEYILKLFHTKNYQKNGLYSIWLNIKGEWKNIIIDDRIPCIKGIPCFSKATGAELWVVLLEKAYAKAYGSYFKIEGGNPAIALRDLTGAPYQNLDSNNPDEVWNYLIQHDNNGKSDILICYTKSAHIKEEQNKLGILAGHAYSILDIKQIFDYQVNKQVGIIKIRNPWGKVEWNGDWSDNSLKWTPQLKEQLNLKNENDGSFWIQVEDFVKYYEGIGLCQIKDNYKCNSIKVDMDNQQNAAIVKLIIKQRQVGWITLNQDDSRFFKQDIYNYSFSTIIVTKHNFETNQIQWVSGNFDYDRNNDAFCIFEPGEYFVFVEVLWNQNYTRNIVINHENIDIVLPPGKEIILLCKFDALKDFSTSYNYKSSITLYPSNSVQFKYDESMFLKPNVFNDKISQAQNKSSAQREISITNFRLGPDNDIENLTTNIYQIEQIFVNSF